VQDMDGRELRYEDERFDFVFSNSSIEHFGSLEDIVSAVREAARVLRPGGVLSLSTEHLVLGRPQVADNTRLLDVHELETLVVESGLDILSPLELDIDPGPPVSFKRALRDIRRTGSLQEFPHILLEYRGSIWTSVHLALTKPA